MNQLLVRAFLALHREEEGQTLLEYAIIISLVSVSAIAVLEAISTFAPGVFDKVAGDL